MLHMSSILYYTDFCKFFTFVIKKLERIKMGSTPGKVSYEYKRSNCHEKSVAAEVVVAPDEAVEKSVAEELKVPDPSPVDADKAIADSTVQPVVEPEEVTEEVVEGEVVKTKKPKKKVE